MTTLTIHWMKPILPTVLGDLELLPYVQPVIIPTDSTWVFPGALDLNKLKHALAQTLRDFPHAAGRLAYNADEQLFSIRLTNDAVPIVVSESDLTVTDELMHERHPEVIDSLPMSRQPEALAVQPLLNFKLVNWVKSGESSLSMSWNHVLGDGSTLLRFMNTLSDYYLEKTPANVPTFEEFLQPRPAVDRTSLTEFLPRSWKQDNQSTKTWSDKKSRASRVELKFSAEQLAAIKAEAEKTAIIKISTQDALAGYLMTVLNRTGPAPIEHVTVTLSTRGIPAAPGSNYTPPPSTSVGMCVVSPSSVLSIGDASLSIGINASAIRKAINDGRDPETARRMIAAYVVILHEIIIKGRASGRAPNQNAVSINNQYKWPAGTNHFGYPGQVRFYRYDGAHERTFRIWPANPVKQSDGTWKTYEGGVDVIFSLPCDLKPIFMKAIEDDKRAVGKELIA